MRISQIYIEHFRSINKCQLRFNEITAVIGENNAGKTALLRALNCIFNWEVEKKSFEDNTHQYAAKTNTKINITFDEVPSKAIYSGKLNNGKLLLNFSYSYSPTRRKKTLCCSTSSGIVNVDDSFIVEMKKDIDYVYIPANRGNYDLTWRDGSVFKKVLVEYSHYFTQSRDNASAQVVRVGSSMKTSIFSKIEREIENMSMLDESEHYSFEYTDGLDYSLFLDKVGMMVDESSKKYPVTECGSGIQSLTVIALYRALAKIKGVNVVLGLEEPEINLHPQAQKKLIASIKNGRDESEVQAIISTHSTVMVDELEHDDVILARKRPDRQRGFFTEFSQLEEDFWTKYNLNTYKHNKFFKYKNSEFFFAKYIVIVESSTDAEVIHRLISKKIGEKIYSISIINLDGVKNIKYPYFLLKSLGFSFSMVVDMDFLTQYKSDSLANSRNPISCLPEYKKVLNEHNPVINDLWNDEISRAHLSSALKKSYSSTFDYCKGKKLFPMQYCLEMDLVANATTKAIYCSKFDIPNDDSANQVLLINKKDKIKEAENVVHVVSSVQTDLQYPFSFKKIRKAICDDIENLF